MKKICLSLIALACAVNFCHAQWSTSGSNIYNSNTGNVGIGTITPASNLDVANILSGVHSTNSSLFRLQDLYNSGANGQYFQIIGAGDGTNYTNVSLISNYGYLSLGARADGNATATNALNILSSGNVGIGTTTPVAKLQSTGAAQTTSPTLGSPAGGALLLTNTDNAYGLLTGVAGNGDVWQQAQRVDGSAAAYDLLFQPSGGNVGIGTTNTHGYKFAVNGNAIATSMTVQLYANWPDYVFKKDYRLPRLTDVKNYIDANHRLPEMPSEQEVAKNGLNLGEMNRLLTKKVEELTLYLIEKDKTEKAQEQRIRALETKLNLLLNTPANPAKR